MSRYTKSLEGNKYVAYGFDSVIGYFIDVFKESNVDDEEDEMIIEESSMFTSLSNARMAELMDEYNLPENHIDLVLMDLPIT